MRLAASDDDQALDAIRVELRRIDETLPHHLDSGAGRERRLRLRTFCRGAE
jgi:hypothetical protein